MGEIHHIFEDKQLPVSLQLDIIAVIPKGSKDRRYIVNWRPLMLLETLNKLLSSTLARRLVRNRMVGRHTTSKVYF